MSNEDLLKKRYDRNNFFKGPNFCFDKKGIDSIRNVICDLFYLDFDFSISYIYSNISYEITISNEKNPNKEEDEKNFNYMKDKISFFYGKENFEFFSELFLFLETDEVFFNEIKISEKEKNRSILKYICSILFKIRSWLNEFMSTQPSIIYDFFKDFFIKKKLFKKNEYRQLDKTNIRYFIIVFFIFSKNFYTEESYFSARRNPDLQTKFKIEIFKFLDLINNSEINIIINFYYFFTNQILYLLDPDNKEYSSFFKTNKINTSIVLFDKDQDQNKSLDFKSFFGVEDIKQIFIDFKEFLSFYRLPILIHKI